MFLSHICFVCATLSGDPILHWLCNIDIRTYVTSGVVASHPLCCLADVDSHAGVGGQCRLLLWLRAARQFVLRDLQPPPQPSGGGNSPDVPASLLHHMRSHYSDGPVTKVHAHTHIIHHVHSHATHNSTLNSHFPACCPLQAVGPSPAQHLKPSQRSDNGSDGQSWFREVLQKNAALEPESQSQQAASVCWQPWPGAQHRHSGFLTSFYTHTHTHRGRGLHPSDQQTRQSHITVWPGGERPDSSERLWMLRCWIQCMSLTVWTLCTGCSTHQLLTVSAAERLLIVLNVHSQRTPWRDWFAIKKTVWFCST